MDQHDFPCQYRGMVPNTNETAQYHYGNVDGISATSVNGHVLNNNYYITQKENKYLNQTRENTDDLMHKNYGISRQKPRYAQYSVVTVRIATYRGFPPEVSQTPESLAKAGFFYSGKDDVVFCFFCGQGLKSWEPNDDPWIEHARWAPHCHYLLNMKGAEFVDMVQIAHNDPESEYPDHQEPVDEFVQSNGHGQAGKNDIDFAAKSKDKTENGPARRLMGTIAAQSLLSNGYEYNKVETAIQTFINANGSNKEFTASDLLHTLFAIEDGTLEPSTPKSSNDDVSCANCHVKGQEVNEVMNTMISDLPDIQTLRNENQELKDQTLCKICLEETVSIVFLPCGHLCTCAECAPAVRKCPICRAFIKGTVRTFLS